MRMRHGLTFIVAAVLLMPVTAVPAFDGQPKKLIHFGWGTRDTIYVREHWREMEQMPFDGIGISVAVDRTKPTTGDNTTPNLLGWNLFGPQTFRLEDFRPAIADLKAAKWQKFTDNFLVTTMSSSSQDFRFNWFDNARWKTILHNWRLLVTLAKEGGCKGVILDPEHYGASFFSYAEMHKRADRPFREYEAKARERGRELMTATRDIFPDITVLTLLGHSYVWNDVRSRENTRPVKPMAEAEYSLLVAFLDGMLEGASSRARIVDGYEAAFAFRDHINFERAYDDIKHKAAQLSSVPRRYARQVDAGFGLWLDYGQKWNATDSGKNFFRPTELQASLKAALEVSDRYVWLYSQTPQFFPRSALPAAYLQAITAARSPR